MLAAVLTGALSSSVQSQPPVPALERRGALRYQDPRLTAPPGARTWELYLPRDARRAYGPLQDPKFNVTYPFRLHVQVRAEGDGAADVRFVIHYLRPEDELLARRTGSVLARLHWLAGDYLGRSLGGRDFTNVWLSRDGRPGGEEHQGHVYLFAVGQARAPAEWVREIAHEYSHTVLPHIGPFTAPEVSANGYLGERLFLKWMLADNASTDVWDGTIDGKAYVALQVKPLRDRFLNAGPGDPVADRRDAAGMEHLIGQLLAIEGAYGPGVLRELLRRWSGPDPRNAGRYLAEAVSAASTRLTYDARTFIPALTQALPNAGGSSLPSFRRAGFWLYLTGGTWSIHADGKIPAGTKATLELATLTERESGRWETTIPSPNGAWRRLELEAPPGDSLEMNGLLLQRTNDSGG